jgi:hypothetical protein
MQSVHNAVDSFDRSNGNGSSDTGDDWLDTNSIFGNEWGSQAATTFNPSDSARNQQDQMERLYKLNNGKYDSRRSHDVSESYVANDTETFMSVLELPSRQRETVREILDNLDISSNNFGSRKYEKIILTVCSLVADEALSNRRNPSLDERLFLTDAFRDLMDVNRMSGSEHRKLRVAIREKSDYF